MTKPPYGALPIYTDKADVERVLQSNVREELMQLSLGIGRNWVNWKYAQTICLRLAEHEDAAVRANACLAFSYIAQAHGKLEKHLIKPVVLRELKAQVKLRARIELAIEEINYFMGWSIAVPSTPKQKPSGARAPGSKAA
jgi:hypothetical protein